MVYLEQILECRFRVGIATRVQSSSLVAERVCSLRSEVYGSGAPDVLVPCRTHRETKPWVDHALASFLKVRW